MFVQREVRPQGEAPLALPPLSLMGRLRVAFRKRQPAKVLMSQAIMQGLATGMREIHYGYWAQGNNQEEGCMYALAAKGLGIPYPGVNVPGGRAWADALRGAVEARVSAPRELLRGYESRHYLFHKPAAEIAAELAKVGY